jgi:2'-5' RNA ligase
MTLLFHFKPHVTLGRVSAEKVSLDQLQNALQSIKQPAFNCILNEAELRYFRGDKIKTWNVALQKQLKLLRNV